MPLRSKNTGALDSFDRTSDQRKDVLSHFILRAAYCRTEDLRLW